MSHLTKLQSSLQYKNEERITEAMRRLDYQLVSHNFTLSEEKKIVAEIDSLKRSKKVLEYVIIQGHLGLFCYGCFVGCDFLFDQFCGMQKVFPFGTSAI